MDEPMVEGDGWERIAGGTPGPLAPVPMMSPMSAPPAPAPAVMQRGPIEAGERLEAMDFLRGVAILGILVVNLQFFGEPFMEAIYPRDAEAWSWRDRAANLVVKVFFEYKFVSLFSVLFGAGLIMQMTRAAAVRASFTGRYFRRIMLLAIFGLLHGLLLWYGDILFIYACLGSVLFLFRNLRPRTMMVLGAGLVVFAAVLSAGFVGLEMAGQQWEQSVAQQQEKNPAVDDAQEDGAVADGPLRGFEAIWAAPDPAEETWIEGETLAYREGPWIDAFAFRLVSFAMMLVFSIVGFGWHVMAMFLIGGALMKIGFFARERRGMQARMALIFLPIGFLLEGANGWLVATTPVTIGAEDMLGGLLHELGAATLCLGYVGAGAWIATAARSGRVTAPFRAVGRMALTDYLASTVIATFLMYHWGLGWFGTLGRFELLALAPAIYAGLVVLSMLWLGWFRFGPFEWLWRSVTYGRLQPMRPASG